MTSLPIERAARKALGAYYSPPDLVDPMVRWAVRSRSSAVLDPSCGDGAFLKSAARHLLALGARPGAAADLLFGFDLNPLAVSTTAQGLDAVLGRRTFRLQQANFFEVDARKGRSDENLTVDAVIGNPPYIRYQEFSGNLRIRALHQAGLAGVSLTQLTSSWAPFLVHATCFLRRGGRLAFILPEELVHARYADPVRQFLRDRFGEVTVIAFKRPAFPGVQEKVVLLLAEGYGVPSKGLLRLVDAETPADLTSLPNLLDGAESFPSHRAPAKWLPGYEAGPGAGVLEHLEKTGVLVPLATVAKANIGFVSGANDYFVLSRSEATDRRLPESSLQPCVIRARQIRGAFLTNADFGALRGADEKCLLWRPQGRLMRSERAYIRHGERLGLHNRFKCRVRSPWYLVPGVVTPDALFTYMSGSVPRLCLNEAGVAASNNLLSIRMHSIASDLRHAFVVAFYNSATLFSMERIGRYYGGGVLKLEPREADRVLVPSVEIVAAHRDRLRSLEDDLQRQLSAGGRGCLAEVVAAVDTIVLSRLAQNRAEASEALTHARGRLADRRLPARA